MKKILLPAFLFLLLISCRDDHPKNEIEPLTFSEERITAADFGICSNTKCPEIEIDLLKISGETAVSKKINKQLEKHHSRLLNISEENSTPSSLKTAIQKFISQYQRFQEEYSEISVKYEVDISDKIAHKSDSLLVVKTQYYIFSGGAHGYGATNYISFNLNNGAILGSKDLFSNISGFRSFAEEQFRKKFDIPASENINATGFFFSNDSFNLSENIAVLEDEVILIYNPYEIASYAQGEIVLRFQKSEVDQWLKFE